MRTCSHTNIEDICFYIQPKKVIFLRYYIIWLNIIFTEYILFNEINILEKTFIYFEEKIKSSEKYAIIEIKKTI